MKKLIFALLCVSLVSCKKDKNDPDPAKVSTEISSMDFDGQTNYTYTWNNGNITALHSTIPVIDFNVSESNSYLIYTDGSTIDTVGKLNSDGNLYVTYGHSVNGSIETWDTTSITYNSNKIITGTTSKKRVVNHSGPTTVNTQYSASYTIVNDVTTAYSYTSTDPSDLSGSGTIQYCDTTDVVGIFNAIDLYKGIPIESHAFAFASAFGSYTGYLGKQFPRLLKSIDSKSYTYVLENDRVKTVTDNNGFYRTFSY